MNRIDKKFNELKELNKIAFIPYITAGDGGINTTYKAVKTLHESGADILEIGIPYSDPVADGPIIEKASQRALSKGVSLNEIFDMTKKLRNEIEIPFLYMLYYNCIHKYGEDKFLENCRKSGVDGLIIPDLPFEESRELFKKAKDIGIHIISFAAPTSRDRIGKIVNEAEGFLYCISSKGVTGVRNSFDEHLQSFLNEIKKYGNVNRAVGFGISKNEHINALKANCEGVIVGSAIVRLFEQYSSETDKLMQELSALTKELNSATYLK